MTERCEHGHRVGLPWVTCAACKPRATNEVEYWPSPEARERAVAGGYLR